MRGDILALKWYMSREQCLPSCQSSFSGRTRASDLRQGDPLTFLERPVALIPRPRSVKEECLERLIFFGAPSLTRALDNHVEHHQHERDHQSCENLIPSHR